MVTLERTILVLKPWVNGGILDDIRANWEDITYDHVYPEHAYHWPRIGADTYHIVSPPDGESAHVSTDGSHYVPFDREVAANRSVPG
jgi:hypothetical protein